MKVLTTQLCPRWSRLSLEMKPHLSWRSYQTSIPRHWVFLTKIQRFLRLKHWKSEDAPILKPLIGILVLQKGKRCPAKKKTPVIKWTKKTSCGMPSSRPREIKRKSCPLSKRCRWCKLAFTGNWQKEIVRLQTLGRLIRIALRGTANLRGNLKDQAPQWWTLQFLNKIRTSYRWSSSMISKTQKEGLLMPHNKINRFLMQFPGRTYTNQNSMAANTWPSSIRRL